MKKWIGLFISVIATHSFAQLSVTPASNAGVTVYASGLTPTLVYTVTNDSVIEAAHNVIIHPHYRINRSIVTVSETANNCPNPGSLAPQASCTFTLSLQGTSAAGTTELSPQVCRSGGMCVQPIGSNRVAITGTGDAAPTTISTNANTILFSFNDSSTTGLIGTGSSVITITNNGSAAATNVESASLPAGVTETANTCEPTLAADATCQITFTTLTTPNSTQTIQIAGSNTNTLSLPIAPLSVRVYSPPANPNPSNAALMLVKTCTVPEQLLVTNNTSDSVSGISVTKDSGLSDASVTSAMTNCPTTLGAGYSCVIGITAPSSSGSTNTQGNILLNWGSAQSGAILTGVEASGASLPTLSTPASPVTVYGGLVYETNNTCNLVKIATLTNQYSGSGSVTWTAPSYQSTSVPNPATGGGSGATDSSLAAGQINTTAIVYQATPSTSLTSYAAGYCSQYTQTTSGVNYAGWYLPWSNNSSITGNISELGEMYNNLGSGSSNGFTTNLYWGSTESSSSAGRVRNFTNGAAATSSKSTATNYIRCSRAITY